MKCDKCGNELIENSKFCNFCGERQEFLVSAEADFSEADTQDVISTSSSGNEVDEDVPVKSEQFLEVPIQTNSPNPSIESHTLGKPQNKMQTHKKKPNKIVKGLGIGCGTIVVLLILLLTIGILVTSGQATLKVNDLPEIIMGETVDVFGTTDAGNKLTINGNDYSQLIEVDGSFKANIPLQMGDNEIAVIVIKENKESSKNARTIKVRRELKVFEPLLTPISGKEVDEKDIEVVGIIKESNASIHFYNDKIKQETTSDSEGKFKFKLTLDELTTYNYTLQIEQDGYMSYVKPYVLKRIAPVADLSINSSNLGIITNNDVVIKGKTEPKGKVAVTGDLKGETTAASDGTFMLKLQATKAGSYQLSVIASKSGFQDSSNTVTFTREFSEEEKLQAFKDSCEALNYKVLKKNPDNHIGENVKYTGEVIEIQESGETTFMRIAVTDMGYGIWDFNDVIAVNFNNTTDIVEDDISRIYGKVTGSFSYTSVAGWEITIPEIDAEYLEW